MKITVIKAANKSAKPSSFCAVLVDEIPYDKK
jgi:hypothetical protein